MAPLHPAAPPTDASAGPPGRSDPDEPFGGEPAAGLLDPLAGLRPPGHGAGAGWRAVLARWPGRTSTSPGRAVAAAVVVVVVAAAAWWLLRPAPAPVESTLPLASASGASGPAAAGGNPAGTSGASGAVGATSTTVAAELVVQAAGAVASPGVYRLAPGSRVDDLVAAAGGLSAEADGDRVNLAAPLADGERIWVPRHGEEAPPEVVAGTGGGSTGSTGGAADGSGGPAGTPAVVDLNTADAAALDTLPGVGPATAQAILAHRDEQGPFASVDDLLEVRGIGEAKLEQLRPLVRVG